MAAIIHSFPPPATLPATEKESRMRPSRSLTATLATTALIALCSCGATESVGGSGTAAEGVDDLSIVVPADPGGGWDQTGRAMAKVMEEENMVGSAEVTNVPGAGGTTGLAQMATEEDPQTLMVMGHVMLGSVELNKSSVTLDDVTPIASLTEEQEVVVVPADSPYKTLDDLIADVKDRGQDVSVAGGSAGGTDHILAGLIYQAAGLSPSDLNYVPYDGGGESIPALLGGKVDAGVSGAGEYREQVEAGELRALALSGKGSADGYEGVKPLSEQGIDVVLTNWRGVVAPGGISDEDKATMLDLVDDLHSSEAWKDVLETNDWSDAYRTDEEYAAFIDDQTAEATQTLEQIGLVG